MHHHTRHDSQYRLWRALDTIENSTKVHRNQLSKQTVVKNHFYYTLEILATLKTHWGEVEEVKSYQLKKKKKLFMIFPQPSN